MTEIFIEASKKIYNSSVEQWTKDGKPVVGYTCSHLPAEVLHAAGVLPLRLRGMEVSGLEIGDSYFGPFICTMPRCLLQMAGTGKFDFLEGAIVTPGCDSMRRLDECWRKAGKDMEGTLPSFFAYFDVPHKETDYAHDWFKKEVLSLAGLLKKHFVTEDIIGKLPASIELYNHSRKLIKELQQFRKKNDCRITGYDALAVSVASTSMPREVFNSELEKLLSKLKNAAPVKEKGKPRLLVTGSATDDIQIIGLMEDSGALVAAEKICFGHFKTIGTIEGNSLESVAAAYLDGTECPRMFGKYEERRDSILALIEESDIDGVILQNIRFCDLHGSDNGLLEADLRKKGIPSLRIEREYGPLVERERLKMRIDAFIESIRGNLS